jgi:rare lipoprotein A
MYKTLFVDTIGMKRLLFPALCAMVYMLFPLLPGLAQNTAAPATSGYGIYRQEGIASWYGDEFAGRPTASGETFNPDQLTCAHPTLPFGTMLKVTNQSNNRQVTVRVNDRGPYVSARVIDLSRRAAELLDMIRSGTAPVMIESVEAIVLPQSSASSASAQVVTPTGTAPVTAAIPLTTPAASPYGTALSSGTSTPTSAASASAVPSTAAPETAPTVTAPLPAVPAIQLTITTQSAETSTGTAATTPSAPSPVDNPAILVGATPQLGSGKTYRVQVGSFLIPQHAVDAIDKLKALNLNPAYERGGEYYRVVLSGIAAEDIESVAALLGRAGFAEALVREEK